VTPDRQDPHRESADPEKTLHTDYGQQQGDDSAPSEQAADADTPPAPSAASGDDKTLVHDAPTRKLGRFTLIRELGQGGMGAVYLALDPQLGRKVAIKVPNLEGNEGTSIADRFQREAKALASLEHPNICAVYEVTPQFIVMAYIEGNGLDAFINADRPLPIDRVIKLVRKIAIALEHAHQGGVVHRDLKPTNIMINRRNQPVVMDFGLARREGNEDETLTQQGQILGTPAYMPPEQVTGKLEDMGPASDVYALGVILYELLTTKRPLEFNDDLLAMISTIALEIPDPPSTHRSEIDRELDRICMKAMEKNVEDRYDSMAQFADALTTYLKLNRGDSSDPNESLVLDTQRIVSDDLLTVDLASIDVKDTRSLQLQPIGDNSMGDKAEWNKHKVAQRNKKALEELRARAAVRRQIQIVAAVVGGVCLLLLLVVMFVVVDYLNGKVIVRPPLGKPLPAELTITLQSDADSIVLASADDWRATVPPGDYSVALAGGEDGYEIAVKSLHVNHFGRTLLAVHAREEIDLTDPGVNAQAQFAAKNQDEPSADETDTPATKTAPQVLRIGDLQEGELSLQKETLPDSRIRTTFTFRPWAEHGQDASVVTVPDVNNFFQSAITVEADTNFGQHETLDVASSPFGNEFALSRAYLRFDLSWLEEEREIEQAFLVLHAAELANARALRGNNALMVGQLTEPWEEDTVTWQRQPAMEKIADDDGSSFIRIAAGTKEDVVYKIDITPIVQQWHRDASSNLGIGIRLEAETGNAAARFASSDAEDESLRPALLITTTTAAP